MSKAQPSPPTIHTLRREILQDAAQVVDRRTGQSVEPPFQLCDQLALRLQL